MEKTINNRIVEFNCDDLFPNRWSPRAMGGEEISKDELMGLFEAARWAPSAFNGQPWRFIYSLRENKSWDSLFNLLAEPNKVWCKDAAALIVLISKKNFERNDKPDKTHTLSAGSAWQNLALQGTISGLVIHGMAGFDYDKAKEVLEIPGGYDVEMMIVVGKKGNKEKLPEQLKQIEEPSDRKKVQEIVFEGKFKK